MACSGGNGSDGPPPQDDPKDPDFVCTNCHTFVFEMCDRCLGRVNIQEMLAKIQQNKGKNSTKSPMAANTTRPEYKTPERTARNSQSVVEGGVLEGHDDDMNATNETSDSAVLVSITKLDHNKYKYKFKYNTAAANTATPSTSGTQNCEELHEEDNIDYESSDCDTPIVNFDNTDNEEEDSENSNSDRQILQLDNSDNDDPIVAGGYLLCQDQEELEDEEPKYDSDGQEIIPGHQL